ncbi:hypothetical protein BV22DRAFT_1134552 [Leucogyrophana mollusca]|uniref:Uncharacterized protein n=1 Tax=Leucogyrophana mollusca TaxID=85980 RepID=A0ACB8AY87_9AGAM|nr:hypothetical protein BV22DRAFT_1134552 [Leucogyrophana mollusca]
MAPPPSTPPTPPPRSRLACPPPLCLRTHTQRLKATPQDPLALTNPHSIVLAAHCVNLPSLPPHAPTPARRGPGHDSRAPNSAQLNAVPACPREHVPVFRPGPPAPLRARSSVEPPRLHEALTEIHPHTRIVFDAIRRSCLCRDKAEVSTEWRPLNSATIRVHPLCF